MWQLFANRCCCTLTRHNSLQLTKPALQEYFGLPVKTRIGHDAMLILSQVYFNAVYQKALSQFYPDSTKRSPCFSRSCSPISELIGP